tara:strand:+ start:358 stop:855 length:498 start_codon:yes stop_codon:yes gene_type:complete
MANFCEIDSTTNEVKRVCIVDNNIETSDGPLGENNKHADGLTWCNNFWGTDNSYWLQTSFSRSFRGRYAKPGDIYLADEDRFVNPQPFPSWLRNDYTTLDTLDWLPPKGFVPDSDQSYTVGDDRYGWEFNWDEDLVTWKGSKADDPSDDNYYKYNFTSNAWEVIN